MSSEKSLTSRADYISKAMSALPDGLPYAVKDNTLKQITWIVDNDRFLDLKDLQARAKEYARNLLKHKKSVQGERPLTWEDFDVKPADLHEIKDSEIPEHSMILEKQATGAAADQKHYQKAEKEPIEVMQMYFDAKELYGFCKGNALKYILRSRFKGTELKDMEKALQYMQWSVDVLHGVPIDPRKR